MTKPHDEIRRELLAMLRQNAEGENPATVPMSDHLKSITDEATAQKIYDELLRESGKGF